MSGSGSIQGGTATAINAVNAAFSRLDGVALQMATLLRINSSSDDPAGMVAATELERDLITLEHTPGASPEAIIQTTAALSDIRDADFTKAISELIKTRIQARVSIFALKIRLESEELLGLLFDRKA
jgi:flagellin-like hook-associated protein FlgL